MKMNNNTPINSVDISNNNTPINPIDTSNSNTSVTTENKETRDFIPSEFTIKRSEKTKNGTWTLGDELATYDDMSVLEATKVGFNTSIIGTSINNATTRSGVGRGGRQYVPQTKEERDAIFEAVGTDPYAVNALLFGVSSADELKASIDRKKQEDVDIARAASSTITYIPYIIGNMAGNPIDMATMAVPFLTVAKASRFGSFIATTASNMAIQTPAVVASGYATRMMTGREVDIETNCLFMGGITGLFASRALFKAAAPLAKTTRAPIKMTGKPAVAPAWVPPGVKNVPLDEYQATVRAVDTPIPGPKQPEWVKFNDTYTPPKPEPKIEPPASTPNKNSWVPFGKTVEETTTTAKPLPMEEAVAEINRGATQKFVQNHNTNVTGKAQATSRKARKEARRLKKQEKAAARVTAKETAQATPEVATSAATKEVQAVEAQIAAKETVQTVESTATQATKAAATETQAVESKVSQTLTDEAKAKAAEPQPTKEGVNAENVFGKTSSTNKAAGEAPKEAPKETPEVDPEAAAQAESTVRPPDPDYTARLTGDNLIESVSDDPKTKSFLSRFLSNPTKILDLKSYLVSVLDSHNTPDTVKKLIHAMVHFEEGVKGSDGHYYQYTGGFALGDGAKANYVEVLNNNKVQDNFFGDKVYALDDKLRGKYSGQQLQEVQETVYSLIEGGDKSLLPERLAKYADDADVIEYADLLNKSYKARGEELIVRGLIKDNRLGAYSPLVFDTNKIADFCRIHFGKNVKNAKEYLANYLIKGTMANVGTLHKMLDNYAEEFADNKTVQNFVKAYKNKGVEGLKSKVNQRKLKDFNEWLNTEAHKAATGYIDQSRSLGRGVHASAESYDDFAKGFSFLKKRLPWNASFEDNLGDGVFSLNKLRVDAVDAHTRYRARSTGVITDYDTFGKSYDEVQEVFEQARNELNTASGMKPNVGEEFLSNMTMLHKRAYGMTVSENQEVFGLMDAASQMLRNMAFSSFGTYMGLNSFMELSRALRATGFAAILRLVPFADRLFNRWVHNGFTKEDIHAIDNLILGQSMRPLVGLHGAIYQGTRKYSLATSSETINNIVGKAAGITDFIASHSPASYIMRGINTKIDDVFESYALSDLAKLAYSSKRVFKKGSFVSEENLRALNISKKELNTMLNDLKTIFKKDAKGKLIVDHAAIDAFNTNCKASRYTLQRLMKNVRETTMQRRNIDDIFLYEKSKNNSLFSLAMQFKAFSIQSYRKRLIKSIHQYKDGQADLVAQQYLISAGLAGMITLGTTYVRSLGMNDESKEKFFKRSLGITSFEDLNDPSKLTRFLYSVSFNRMSEFAGISLLANSLGFGTGAKTTSSTNYYGFDTEDEPLFVGSSNVARTFTDMFPVINYLQSTVSAGTAAINVGLSAAGVETTRRQDREQLRMISQGISGLPNVPVVTNSLRDYFNEAYQPLF